MIKKKKFEIGALSLESSRKVLKFLFTFRKSLKKSYDFGAVFDKNTIDASSLFEINDVILKLVNKDLACHSFLKILVCFYVYYTSVKTTVFVLWLVFNIYYLSEKLIL